jgi:hypothetical protein
MQLVGESYAVDRTRAATAVVRFFVPTGGLLFAGVPGSHRNLTLTRQEAKQSEDGNYVVTATYEGESGETAAAAAGGSGGSTSADREGRIYEWSPSFEQTDIANHPRIDFLIDKYQGVVDEGTGSVSFPKNLTQTEGGLGGAENPGGVSPMFGVTEFLSLGGTWSEQSLKSNIPDEVFTSIGKVAPDVPGGLPTPEGRFWLTLPPVVVQHGDKWRVTRRWMLSGLSSARSIEAARDIYSNEDV